MIIVEIFLWVILAIPLILYPFILLAGVMSLGAESKPGDKIPLLKNVARLTFLWGSLAYPVVYYFCYMFAQRKSSFTLVLLMALFAFIGVLFLAFKYWEKPDSSKS